MFDSLSVLARNSIKSAVNVLPIYDVEFIKWWLLVIVMAEFKSFTIYFLWKSSLILNLIKVFLNLIYKGNQFLEMNN